ncbi:hypothetical protein VNO78_11888 [Psophocarpus tetragonolobus]|uniref:Uncharacterized protein n=1 Tax=Psophocarpus tetragonolobus TaxID=3891 RepID=A0AAN9SM66_PSOTE
MDETVQQQTKKAPGVDNIPVNKKVDADSVAIDEHAISSFGMKAKTGKGSDLKQTIDCAVILKGNDYSFVN